MSLVKPKGAGRARWNSLYAPIARELAAAEELLRRELRSDDPHVDSLVKHAFRLGGKRLRPALVLLSAQACGEPNSDHLVLAAVVEMIHTATLVHDDVLDEATLRRHQETMNARCDNEASVLVGDFLFTHAFYLASSLDTTFACRTIGRSTNIVCTGELRQIHSRGNFALGEAEYLEIIDAKTAELCACCCGLGAHYADASAETVEALVSYGRNLGIAFQIVDDLLDVLGDESSVGKSLGTDLEKQKPTLPLIRLLDQISPEDRDRVIAALGQGGHTGRQTLSSWFDRTDALDYARAKAGQFAERARQELSGLSASPARDVLEQLTSLVVTRHE